jgi:LuxR family maltose regulon positive regulatory protein
VHERTGGWPVAVYLAAMAMAEQGASASPAQSVAETSALAAYLRDEVLDALPSAQREFLLRTAVLDELSAPACDAVLAGTQSAPLLQALARDRHLVVPVDGAPGTFRIHQLVRELLLSQLAHATPAEIVVLHQRASEWYAARGDLDAAIEHAFAAGVDDDVDQLVWRAYIPFLGGGLSHTVSRWLDAVEYDAKRARPVFAVTSAWHALTIGDMPSTRLWCEIVNGLDPELCLPDGTPVAVVAALMRALVAGDGIVAMRDDALLAERGHARSAPLRTMTLLLAGHGERLLGNDAAARRLLEEGVAFGALVNPAGEIHCRIGLALMAAAAGDWTTATASSERAFELIEALGLQNRPAMSLPTAITAYLWAREGRSEARDLLKRGVFLVSALGGVGAWMGIEARVWLARAARQLGDPSTARGLDDEAEALVPEASESSMLAAAVSSLDGSLDARALVLTLHATPMTPAELRVLRYLPTHLTFAAIASELFVSRNTVKTQAIAVYWKLGVTSREGAVEEARRLGLLDS